MLDDDDQYDILRDICNSGDKLKSFKDVSPLGYFYDFDPTVNFDGDLILAKHS